MSRFRSVALAAVFALVIGACAPGSGTPGVPGTGGPPITTPEGAWAAVVRFEPRFAAIGLKDPDLIGQSTWYEVQAASGVGAFIAMVEVGWGDCPAGCIDRHTWTLAIGPDGAVSVVSEDGPVVPPGTLPDAGQVTTGIRIQATAGPVCPVEQDPPDPACAARPVVGARITIKDGAGGSVAGGVTGLLGTLDVALPSGAYTIEAAPVEGLMGTPAPTAATVADGALSTIDLGYDTGIR